MRQESTARTGCVAYNLDVTSTRATALKPDMPRWPLRWRRVSGLTLPAIMAVCFTLAAIPVKAQTETPLYYFKGKQDGANPSAAVIFGPQGLHLFGTTPRGGTANIGQVFRINPPPTGQTAWTKNTIYSFLGAGGHDGGPVFSPVITDKTGALYGETIENGSQVCCGLIFKITPPAKGFTVWTESILYRFSGPDGDWPYGGLVMDSSGALYGATKFGGTGLGTVFKLTPPAAGGTAWTESVLYEFAGGTDGATPNGGLILDSSGALLGTTVYGGLNELGTAFVLNPPTSRVHHWTETIIHNFEGDATDAHDGAYPNGGMVGGVGAVYGTTQSGGAASPCCGVVFSLVQQILGSPVYTLTVLHQFTGGQDGANPAAGLLRDSSGNLWGTTIAGGAGVSGSDFGTIFKLTPNRIVFGDWSYKVIYSFNGSPDDGAIPESPLIEDSSGSFYGTTSNGGPSGLGTVYKLTP